jgi:hypothetical protein
MVVYVLHVGEVVSKCEVAAVDEYILEDVSMTTS